MTVKTEAMVEVASTFIAKVRIAQPKNDHDYLNVNAVLGPLAECCVRSPSGRDNKFKAESNCALEHSRTIADVKSVPD